MLKDIPQLKATGIAMAVIRDEEEDEWVAYILNLKENPVQKLMITSKGYGEIDGKKKETSQLRYYVENMEARNYYRLELISEEVLVLNNEFMIIYYDGDHMYDRKFIFLPDSIRPENFTSIPILNKKGILIM